MLVFLFLTSLCCLWIVSFSEVHILVLTIGISCAAMFILVVVVVIWRHWRRMQQDKTREVGR